MKCFPALVGLMLLPAILRPDEFGFETPYLPIVKGLKNPESVATGFGKKIFVSHIGEFGKKGDGGVVRVEKGKAVPFVSGLNDPKGLAAFGKWLFVADLDRVVRIDEKGTATDLARPEDFPVRPHSLNDLAIDATGRTLYVSDSGAGAGKCGSVFRVPLALEKGKGKITILLDGRSHPLLCPNGLLIVDEKVLILGDSGTGEVLLVPLAGGKPAVLADGLGAVDGLAQDRFGRIFVTDFEGGRMFVLPRPGIRPIPLPLRLDNPADLCLDSTGGFLLVPDMKQGTVHRIAARIHAEDPLLPGPGLRGTWKEETRPHERASWKETRWLAIDEDRRGPILEPVRFSEVGFHTFPPNPFENAERTSTGLSFEARLLYGGKDRIHLRYVLKQHREHEMEGEITLVEAPAGRMHPRRLQVRWTRIPDASALRLDLLRLHGSLQTEVKVQMNQAKLHAGETVRNRRRLAEIDLHLRLLAENIRAVRMEMDRR